MADRIWTSCDWNQVTKWQISHHVLRSQPLSGWSRHAEMGGKERVLVHAVTFIGLGTRKKSLVHPHINETPF